MGYAPTFACMPYWDYVILATTLFNSLANYFAPHCFLGHTKNLK
jgi:hypothetical protein